MRLCAHPLVVVVLALAVALPVQQMVDHVKQEYRLGASEEVLRGRSPGEVLATAGLGGFRGLVVDYLWLRAMQMQDERRFYEIVLLCQLILKMEPYFTHIWAFQAWNMAYNISLELPEAEDRWTWVERSINMLEEEGIPRNSDSYLLYWELAWFYFHRCSPRHPDPYTPYYREQIVKSLPPGETPSPTGIVFERAEHYFSIAIEKSDITPVKRRRTIVLIIACLEARGMYAQAEERFKSLLAETPADDLEPRRGLINFYKRRIFYYHVEGNTVEARRWHGRMLSTFPGMKDSLDDVVEHMTKEMGETQK